MKKIKLSIIIALLFFLTIAQAQTTEPVFSKKSSWTEIRTNMFDHTFFRIITYKIDGDTLIGDKNYSKVYANNDYSYALRETEDHRIYASFWNEFLYPATEVELFVYDFDWYPGKTLYHSECVDDMIDSVIFVVLGSSIDSIQLLDGKYYQYAGRLIRGIGNTAGIFRPYCLWAPSSGEQRALLCFYIDDTLVYRNPDFNDCSVTSLGLAFSKNSSWTEITTNRFDDTFQEINTYKIDGDTLIGSTNYSKLLRNNNFYSALRETGNNRIYVYFPDLGRELLIYDFDWDYGKTLYSQTWDGDVVIQAVVPSGGEQFITLLDGKRYRSFSTGSFRLIKGIGDTRGFFASTFETPTNGDQTALLCFYRGDTLIYRNPSFNDCFVAVTGIINVPTTAMVDTLLTLSGTVIPNNATSRNIVWNVYDAGTTGATIIGNRLHATAKGIVVVTATISHGVALDTAYTQNFTIEVKPMSINEPQEFSNIKVYPNPSNHSITVDFLGNLEVNIFKIFDLKGKLIKSYEVRGKNTITIEAQDLAKGAYVYAAILKNNQKLSGKIIIQ